LEVSPELGHAGSLEKRLSRSTLNWQLFDARRDAFREAYRTAEPWPHLIIDGFLPEDVALEAAHSFPKMDWRRYRLARLFGARVNELPPHSTAPVIASIIKELHGPHFIKLIESITGISGLVPDLNLFGSGIHQGARGSVLRLHADHNCHPTMGGFYRRVNVMLYLNDRWQSSWNGDLQLWDREALGCAKSISPISNRCVIMGVDDTAFHCYGPLRLPRKLTRNAIAVYYYAAEPAVGQDREPHITLWPTIRGENPVVPALYRLRRAALAAINKRLQSDSNS
jgi:hypothetical protein